MADKRLGCGEPTVYINTVGGDERLAALNISSVTYGRRLDEISECRVELAAGQDAKCAELLAKMDGWYFEASVFRDAEEAWVGPITELAYTQNTITLTARDMYQWFERRILPIDRAFVNTDLSIIAVTYLSDALNIDTTPNIIFTAFPCGINGTRSILGITKRRAADEIRELARGGLDFTTIRREVRFGGKEVFLPRLPTLTEDIFEITNFRKAGLQMANHIFVFGNTPQGVTTPLVGEAGGMSLPIVQTTFSEPSVLDVPSANAAAKTRWDLLNFSPEYVTGRLLEDAPVELEDLIPGAIVPVRQQVGYRYINNNFRLVAVEVSASVGQGLTERVGLVLQSEGTTE